MLIVLLPVFGAACALSGRPPIGIDFSRLWCIRPERFIRALPSSGDARRSTSKAKLRCGDLSSINHLPTRRKRSDATAFSAPDEVSFSIVYPGQSSFMSWCSNPFGHYEHGCYVPPAPPAFRSVAATSRGLMAADSKAVVAEIPLRFARQPGRRPRLTSPPFPEIIIELQTIQPRAPSPGYRDRAEKFRTGALLEIQSRDRGGVNPQARISMAIPDPFAVAMCTLRRLGTVVRVHTRDRRTDAAGFTFSVGHR